MLDMLAECGRAKNLDRPFSAPHKHRLVERILQDSAHLTAIFLKAVQIARLAPQGRWFEAAKIDTIERADLGSLRRLRGRGSPGSASSVAHTLPAESAGRRETPRPGGGNRSAGRG